MNTFQFLPTLKDGVSLKQSYEIEKNERIFVRMHYYRIADFWT